jgi:hypothetical protein
VGGRGKAAGPLRNKDFKISFSERTVLLAFWPDIADFLRDAPFVNVPVRRVRIRSERPITHRHEKAEGVL